MALGWRGAIVQFQESLPRGRKDASIGVFSGREALIGIPDDEGRIENSEDLQTASWCTGFGKAFALPAGLPIG